MQCHPSRCWHGRKGVVYDFKHTGSPNWEGQSNKSIIMASSIAPITPPVRDSAQEAPGMPVPSAVTRPSQACGVRMWTMALACSSTSQHCQEMRVRQRKKLKQGRETPGVEPQFLSTPLLPRRPLVSLIFLIAINKYLTRNKEAGGGCGRAVWGHSLSPWERLGSRGRGRWLHTLHPGHAQLTFSFSASFRS